MRRPLSLLATTNAESEAVEAELPPNRWGADFASLYCQKLRARVANLEGLTALVSLSHLDQATEAFLAKLKITKRSSVGSSLKFIAVSRGMPMSIHASAPPWNGIPPLDKPCSRPRAEWS